MNGGVVGGSVGAIPRGGSPGRAAGISDAGQPWPAFFACSLALYLAVVVGRIHEAIPFVAKLYLGKTTALVLIVAAVMQLRGDAFTKVLKTTAMRSFLVITVIGILSVPVS